MISTFGLFRVLSRKLRIIIIGGAIAAIAAGYGLWHHKVFNSGWNAAIAAIAAQDKEAIDAARSARANWRSCVDDGGVWNASTGQCRRR
jgi:hypothetical protein